MQLENLGTIFYRTSKNGSIQRQQQRGVGSPPNSRKRRDYIGNSMSLSKERPKMRRTAQPMVQCDPQKLNPIHHRNLSAFN